MTEVTEAQRIALVEFIAHLITENWEAVCTDLVTLGFIPPGQISPVEAGLVPLMVEIMGKVVKVRCLTSGSATAPCAWHLQSS